MARTLILGGTRNLGHVTALSLLGAGHDVTVLNRGQTTDDLPRDVGRLRADRNDDASMRAALGDSSFDLVLDNTTYTERDAQQAVDLFTGRAARYVFISSGQVYLVRENLPRPFSERDYPGPVMAEPPRHSADYSSWLYGIDKRLAEQIFQDAAEKSGFPVMTLRLPSQTQTVTPGSHAPTTAAAPFAASPKWGPASPHLMPRPERPRSGRDAWFG